MEEQLVLSAGLLTTATVEGIKAILRKWVVKDPTYDFPPYYYTVGIPLFTALWGIGLGYVGWGPEVVANWQTLVNWALASVLSVGIYELGLKPIKEYSTEYRADSEDVG